VLATAMARGPLIRRGEGHAAHGSGGISGRAGGGLGRQQRSECLPGRGSRSSPVCQCVYAPARDEMDRHLPPGHLPSLAGNRPSTSIPLFPCQDGDSDPETSCVPDASVSEYVFPDAAPHTQKGKKKRKKQMTLRDQKSPYRSVFVTGSCFEQKRVVSDLKVYFTRGNREE